MACSIYPKFPFLFFPIAFESQSSSSPRSCSPSQLLFNFSPRALESRRVSAVSILYNKTGSFDLAHGSPRTHNTPSRDTAHQPSFPILRMSGFPVLPSKCPQPHLDGFIVLTLHCPQPRLDGFIVVTRKCPQPCLGGFSVVPSVLIHVWEASVLCQVSSAMSGLLQCCDT